MAREGYGNAIGDSHYGNRGYTDDQLTFNDICKEIKRQYVAMELLKISGARMTTKQNNFRSIAAKYFAPIVLGKMDENRGERRSIDWGENMLMAELDTLVQILRTKYPRLQRGDVAYQMHTKKNRLRRLRQRLYPKPCFRFIHGKPDRLYPLGVFKHDSRSFASDSFNDSFYDLYSSIKRELDKLNTRRRWLNRWGDENRWKMLKTMQRLPARILYASPALFTCVMSGTYCIERRLTMKECWQIMNGTRTLPQINDSSRYAVLDKQQWLTPLQQKVAGCITLHIVDRGLLFSRGKFIFNRDAFRVKITRSSDMTAKEIITEMLLHQQKQQ